MKQNIVINKNNYSVINACRLCKSKHIVTIMNFGNVPLANSYPFSQHTDETHYPLTVAKCDECGHVQLKETVKPDILFSEYAYASSDSPSLIKHFKEYASTVTSKLQLGEFDQILEIGSNDGILLNEFTRLGLTQTFGVEPAINIASRSLGKGSVIYNQFFNSHLAQEMLIKHGTMDVICANNVFAHIADIDSVIEGIVKLLSPDGVFVFENAYLLDTIRGKYFDQVYHEHLQYFGIKPLVKYLNTHGLTIFDIERVSTQGGSFRIYACRTKSTKYLPKPSVQSFLKEEEDFNLYEFSTYTEFNNNLVGLVKKVKAIIQYAEADNKTVSCYGCPAKFALFSQVFGLTSENIKYVVEDSPLKSGRFSPGKKIPIVNGQVFRDSPTDYCIITAWNMAQSIIERNPQYKGNWVTPLPSVEIIKKS